MKRRVASLSRSNWIALAVVVVGTWLFWDTWLTWPVQLYVVFVHECGHAIAALLTGGEVRGIQIHENLGGVTSTVGGFPLLILPAGYVASAAFGGLLILGAAHPRSARTTLLALAAFSGIFGLALVRPVLALALPFALISAAAFAWLGTKAPQRVAEWVLLYLAFVSSIYSIIDVKEDLLHWHSTRVTDATMLADRTYVPAVIWGLVFAALAIGINAAALRKAIRDS